MEKSFSESYKAAGVDITAGYKSVELMKQHIKRTLTSGAMSDIGGFGGLFDLKDEMCSEPILVSGTDGVGTKQRALQDIEISDNRSKAPDNAKDFLRNSKGQAALFSYGGLCAVV